MRYESDGGTSYRIDDDGNREVMANFTAEIVEETHIVDGINRSVKLRIVGEQQAPDDPDKPRKSGSEPDTVKLPAVDISADDFPSMGWVLSAWGVRCVIRPGQSIKDDLRAFVQLRSRPKVITIYRNTGWAKLDDGQRGYLHAGGAITRTGNRPSVRVQLSPELSRYDLSSADPKVFAKAAKASLDLLNLTRQEVTWPLLAATVAPLYGPVDFAVHISGRTGTFKSELVSLFQSHYGPAMDARHLPGSWSSTANAIEAQAFYCKDALYALDDFVPTGTSWQVRAYQTNADKIIRAAGNQAGRARLTDLSSLQTTMYPRSLILSTGEDTPEGHSVRARMLILELSPGDIDPKELSKAQANRPIFCGTIAELARQQAGEPTEITKLVETYRAEFNGIGHTRTPSMLARLVASAEVWIASLVAAKVIDSSRAGKLKRQAREAIAAAGNRQQFYLEDADPTDQFSAAIRQLLASGGGHLRSLNGGVPKNAPLLGWSEETSLGEMPTFKSRGPCIGWVNWQSDELFLEINVGYNAVRKASGNELTLSKQTMFKRLKDSGLLVRSDDARQRNTIRITAEGHPRQVIALSLSQTLETQEKPQ